MKENVTADETVETAVGEEVVAAEGESETSDNAETSNAMSQGGAIVAANNAEQGERQSENTIEGSDFTGSALAYFGINILWLLGTIFSLGIAYPFLTAWKLRWVANHTWYDGKKVVFDGTGPQLFGSYIKWLLLSLVTCGIYWIFVMPLNIKRWKTKHMHFEGEEGESHFDGSIWGLFGQRFVCNLVTFITLGLGWFWAHCHRERWYAKHTYIDGYRLRFEGKGMQFFGKCIVWVLLTIVTLGIYGIWLAVKTKKWTARKTHIEGQFIARGVTSTPKKGSAQAAESKSATPPETRIEQYVSDETVDEKSTKNGMAIAGFVLGLVGMVFTGYLFVCSIIGLVLSIIGLSRCKKAGLNGKGFAIAGIVLSAISLLFSIATVAVHIVVPITNGYLPF